MPEERSARKRVFSYDEAVSLMPEVRRLTEEAYRQVETLADGPRQDPQVQAQLDRVIRDWAHRLEEMGIEVKDLWLIDFDNGSGYYCWRYPEETLQFYH